MSSDRWTDTRVERAAVLAVERSVIEHTELITATPATDFGIDLLAFHTAPFGAVPIQVKGASSGLTVWRKYTSTPLIIAYVLDPLGDVPTTCIMTGDDAWQLPFEYAERGGGAKGHDCENDSYRWPSVTKLLHELLIERQATKARWNALFEEVRAR
ncbi:hypothetical protein [Leucobacter chinensis]|uniref:hypothetical protein n=1 Tax=Leucobacter chinensis TaxID=2851010 RepID=UPI001C20FED3|nr:hypothetical protein [Leucobacter chinensis]